MTRYSKQKLIFTILVLTLLIYHRTNIINAFFPKEYPNVTLTDLCSDLTWTKSKSEVDEILSNKYNLVLLEEETNKSVGYTSEILEYSGGKFNGIPTKSWKILYKNKNISNISIEFAVSDNQSKIKNMNKLGDVIVASENPEITIIDFNKTYKVNHNNKFFGYCKFRQPAGENKFGIVFYNPKIKLL